MAPKATYSPPTIKVMDTDELLKVFQFTSANSGWWVPGSGMGDPA